MVAPLSHGGSSLALLALLLLAVSCSGPPSPQERWQNWSTLRLEVDASRLLHGEVEIRRTTRGELPALETRATASLLGQPLEDSRTLTLFDAEGRTRSHARQSRRGGRRFVFDEAGYTVERLRPPEDPDRPLDQWEVSSRTTFDYPDAEPGSAPPRLSDFFGMLLELRQAGLREPGDQATVHVATSSGPRSFRIGVRESREASRTFLDLSTDDLRTVRLREFRLRIRPTDPDLGVEGFLRMEGETEIWVEAESKTPLEISGKLPQIPGRIRLRLVALG
jgi:hypothetical protein